MAAATSKPSGGVGDPSKKKKIYSKFQFKDQVFEIGDICRFYNESGDLIGKILGIVSTDANHKDFGKLKVQWLYTKRDLDFKKLKIKEEDQEQIAVQEVFPTQHFDQVYVQCINGKCKILNLEEFEAQAHVPPDVFFTRANYDHVKKELKPPYQKWDKLCSCKKPCNPMQQYIMCESCSQWFHP